MVQDVDIVFQKTDKHAADAQEEVAKKHHAARVIAFYLPQYHPIPENNEWWGPGFTEWTNVASAKPLFRGHQQPRFPANLGFYDLRVPEVRRQQAEMARDAGIEGFCYWHYWFGNGRRLLERPFNEVISSGEPNFPFCLAWANQTWTGVWHGASDRILVEQRYPGDKDYREHFFSLLPAFTDDRYIKVEGKPVFVVYRPRELPDSRRFCNLWREYAHEAGLPGLYLVAIVGDGWDEPNTGFDIRIPCEPGTMLKKFRFTRFEKLKHLLLKQDLYHSGRPIISRPLMYDYSRVISTATDNYTGSLPTLPCVVPNWDNTPRCGARGFLFTSQSPELYGVHLRNAVKYVKQMPDQEPFIFIKSWNEWAEGNFLEPDQRYGLEYLEVTNRVLKDSAFLP